MREIQIDFCISGDHENKYLPNCERAIESDSYVDEVRKLISGDLETTKTNNCERAIESDSYVDEHKGIEIWARPISPLYGNYFSYAIISHKGIEIWARPISPLYGNYFSYAIAFLNRRTDGTPSDVAVTLQEMGLLAPGGYRIQDLYEDVDYGILTPLTKIKVKVNPSGVVILRADVQPSYKVPFRPNYLASTTAYNPFLQYNTLKKK
ncbi:uncharacterized protein LOC113465314 [Diaphorina citri]|uniref:Uncharacterized protein LOC113465314 n=1 Tax=Diaphorina citri TaxID=121845 RepID=A0A3Q0JET0_DIACI|nr:uncharacterized protein LOC113465314 [Diaphorina citri]